MRSIIEKSWHGIFAAALVLGAAGPGGARDADFGEPLPGLDGAQLQSFNDGKQAFVQPEEADEGLGPVFNDTSCGICHNTPAFGGGSIRLETRFGARTAGRFDPLAFRGGSLRQDMGIGAVAGKPGCSFAAEQTPPEANVVAQRRATPLFGLGLVDAVPDASLRALAALQKLTTPRTAGAVSTVVDVSTQRRVVGKFGWKAQVPTLLQFSGDAYVNELGVTNPLFPDENCPQGNCDLLRACNPVPGVNDDGEDLRHFADFMTLLAPPPRGPVTPEVVAGGLLFNLIGCASCHTPTLRTGLNRNPALSGVAFHPYSDFLLHDMGALGDGIEQGDANGRMMRTAPLWGLRRIETFLHDGRAATPSAAIEAHDGQGAAARDAYRRLNDAQKARLASFLRSL